MFPPHAPLRMVYPATGMLPQLLFGLPAKWLGGPRLGLIGYQLALTIAVLSPAVWAAVPLYWRCTPTVAVPFFTSPV